MDLKSLKLLLDEVTRQVTDRRILLFGSSSLLASYPEEEPDRIGVETTIDADFFIDPDDKAFRVALLAELGKEQSYHIANGYYGDFVDLRMAEGFPQGWRERLVPRPTLEMLVTLPSGGAASLAVSAVCPLLI